MHTMNEAGTKIRSDIWDLWPFKSFSISKNLDIKSYFMDQLETLQVVKGKYKVLSTS